MDRESISEQNPEPSAAASTATEADIANSAQELRAALQLLANRARYITAASTAIIAIGEGNGLVCKASSGATAPPAETQLQIDGGLTSELMGECVTNRMPVRCDDAENDERINSDECRQQHIGSLLLVPLLKDQDIAGIFQLTADRKAAFEERDVASLQRLADAVRTVLEQTLTISPNAPVVPGEQGKLASLTLRSGRIPLPQNREFTLDDATRLSGGKDLRRCKGCGFPVSTGRTLCLDCEAAEIAHGRFHTDHPSSLFPYGDSKSKKSWFDEHFYTIGIVLVSVLTLIVLLLWARQ